MDDGIPFESCGELVEIQFRSGRDVPWSEAIILMLIAAWCQN